MKINSRWMHGVFLLFIIAVLGLALPQLRSGEPKADPQEQERGQTSYMKVDITEPFSSIMARMTAAEPGIEKEHADLLNERYDLALTLFSLGIAILTQLIARIPSLRWLVLACVVVTLFIVMASAFAI